MSAPETPLTVLLVEDDSDIRSLLRLRIERLGHRVVEAANGEAAIRLAHLHHPVLIVLDILLPGIDGWEVIRRLRADDKFTDVPVMVVSIVDHPESPEHPPVQGYVPKPFRTGEFDEVAGRLIAAGMTAPVDDEVEQRGQGHQ